MTNVALLLQEQLAQLGTEHAQAVTALQEALAGLQAAKQAGEASRRDNGALRENALHMRAVQVRLSPADLADDRVCLIFALVKAALLWCSPRGMQVQHSVSSLHAKAVQ